MKIYKVSCYSSCGTYFAAYLQSVTVLAENGTDAIEVVKEWFKESGEEFIEKDSSKWEVTQLVQGLQRGIVDYVNDSDY